MGTLVAPDQPPILLVEIQIGALILRFAERPVLVGEGSAAIRFHGGLSADICEEIELTASGPPTRQVSLQVASEQSWGALGAALEAAIGRLYLWGGGSLDDAELLLVGRVSEPAICDPDMPPGVAALTLSEVEGDDKGLLLETAVVGEETFPADGNTAGVVGDQVVDAYAGAYYPEVIGRPGYPFPAWYSSEAVAPGSPAVFAQHRAGALYTSGSTIIVKRGVSRVSTARLWGSNNYSDGVSLQTARDLRGQTYTAVTMSTIGGGVPTPAAAEDVATGWAVGWTSPPTTGPGGALRGLGDVLVWALERAGVDRPGADRGLAWDIDWGNTLDCRASLNRFKLDTYIADQVGVWSWLTSDILPFFPVFLGRTGRGLYISEWRYRAAPSEALITLEIGRNAYRVSVLASLELSDAYTELSLRLGLQVITGEPVRELRYSGAAVAGSLDAGGRSALLERLYSQVGRRATTLDIPVVWDTATGWEVAEYLSYRYAAPLREVWYRLPWQLCWVRPGVVVRIVDAEAGLDVLGTITARKPGPGCLDVRVLLHPGG